VLVEQLLRPEASRSLHRRALAGDLPARIAARHDKRGPNATLLRTVNECWPEFVPLLERSRLVQHGLVRERAWTDALQRARFGRTGWDLMALLKSLALEVWLRAHERPQPLEPDAARAPARAPSATFAGC
jgi:hypothetical protein